MAKDEQTGWIVEMLMASVSVAPAALLEEVMADERCVAFGPIHHFIVGAVLLACWRNAEASGERDAMLKDDLADLMSRSDCVPGATCARWGMCGAAASAGMAYAIVRGNAPLRSEAGRRGSLWFRSCLPPSRAREAHGAASEMRAWRFVRPFRFLTRSADHSLKHGRRRQPAIAMRPIQCAWAKSVRIIRPLSSNREPGAPIRVGQM